MLEKFKPILKKVANITIGVLAGLMVLVLFFNFLNKEDQPYDIKDPLIGNHAVIQIKTKEGGFCSAFVVSDTTAFTAGHCIDFAENQQVFVKKDIKKIEDALGKIQIMAFMAAQQCPQEDPRCVAIMNKMGEAVNQLSQRLAYLKSLKPTEYEVLNSKGENTKIIATALHKELGRQDFGVIKGDFKNFQKLPLMKGFTINQGDKLRMCGFPGGTVPAVCTDMVADGPYTRIEKNYTNFGYRTIGMLVPGSSGSAVIDSNGIVVGIAVSAGEEYSYITPLVGLYNSK